MFGGVTRMDEISPEDYERLVEGFTKQAAADWNQDAIGPITGAAWFGEPKFISQQPHLESASVEELTRMAQYGTSQGRTAVSSAESGILLGGIVLGFQCRRFAGSFFPTGSLATTWFTTR